mmetsp:Transcript_26294/g.63361  ORF Transcript_26294/g.63361 Transcript_26294/m.63361 type:complete len:239 (+) Transcript_26294:618-1334(+)
MENEQRGVHLGEFPRNLLKRAHETYHCAQRGWLHHQLVVHLRPFRELCISERGVVSLDNIRARKTHRPGQNPSDGLQSKQERFRGESLRGDFMDAPCQNAAVDLLLVEFPRSDGIEDHHGSHGLPVHEHRDRCPCAGGGLLERFVRGVFQQARRAPKPDEKREIVREAGEVLRPTPRDVADVFTLSVARKIHRKNAISFPRELVYQVAEVPSVKDAAVLEEDDGALFAHSIPFAIEDS